MNVIRLEQLSNELTECIHRKMCPALSRSDIDLVFVAKLLAVDGKQLVLGVMVILVSLKIIIVLKLPRKYFRFEFRDCKSR